MKKLQICRRIRGWDEREIESSERPGLSGGEARDGPMSGREAKDGHLIGWEFRDKIWVGERLGMGIWEGKGHGWAMGIWVEEWPGTGRIVHMHRTLLGWVYTVYSGKRWIGTRDGRRCRYRINWTLDKKNRNENQGQRLARNGKGRKKTAKN